MVVGRVRKGTQGVDDVTARLISDGSSLVCAQVRRSTIQCVKATQRQRKRWLYLAQYLQAVLGLWPFVLIEGAVFCDCAQRYRWSWAFSLLAPLPVY